MEYIIKNTRHDIVFNIFEEICAIPHGSGNEGEIAKYIANYANTHGALASIDENNNVFVRKQVEGSTLPPVLLQGHMDMVCEKNSDVEHDFLHDGLKLFVENGKIGAYGTTLGADDGMAVAYMLALLSEDLKMPLEMLFTVCEETGLEGAKTFDVSNITAKKMINLDSEEDNVVTAGCAGGVRTDIVIPLDHEAYFDGCLVKISGLAGGHSGAEINSGKSSAVTLMGRLLARLLYECDIRIASVSCNGKDNAIARECEAYVCGDKKKIESVCESFYNDTKKELLEIDCGFNITVGECERLKGINKDISDKIITLLATARCGVLKMSNDIEGLVEYSRNLGTIKTVGDEMIFTFSNRSSIEAQLDASIRELELFGISLGGRVEHYERYPGWEYASVSPLREEYIDAYVNLFNKEPAVSVIHAGLECGILSDKLSGDIDIISVGPDLYDIHSPSERADIASCERIYDVLLYMLCK